MDRLLPIIFLLGVFLIVLPCGTPVEADRQWMNVADHTFHARRAKRQTDNSDLVVDMSYKMKKNKSITVLSEEEKQNMVHIHNAYRSLVRPMAANMIEVTWDDDIAAFAQEWANECTATHRPNRNLDPWIGMGENLYWWYSGAYNEAMSVKWWWDEVQYYTIQDKSCVSGEVCGHYVTMAWAKSEKIGCGVARCDRLWDLPDFGRGAYYFVCSYNGRFLSNTKPYTATDIPCSSCHQTNYPKCRYNLCVTQDMIDNDIGYNGSTEITGLKRSFEYSSPKTRTTPTTTLEPTTTTTTTTTTTPEPTTTTTTTTTTTPEPTTTTTTTLEPTTTTTTPEPTTTTTTTPEPTPTTTKTTEEPTTTTTTTTTQPPIEETSTSESTTQPKIDTTQTTTTSTTTKKVVVIHRNGPFSGNVVHSYSLSLIFTALYILRIWFS